MKAAAPTKLCRRCCRELPADEAHFRRRRPGGAWQSWCRECQHDYDRQRRPATKVGRGRPRKYSADPVTLLREIQGRLRALEIALCQAPNLARSPAEAIQARKSDRKDYCKLFGAVPGRVEVAQ